MRATHQPRILLFLPISLVVACGITFSPGDYSAPGETSPVVGNDASTNAPETSAVVDGGLEASVTKETGAPPPSLHVLLFAGTKDKEVDANDVWSAPVDDTGTVGAFEYLQPTPLSKPLQAVAMVNGRLLTVLQGSSSRVVQSADFAGGFTSAWTTAVVPNPPTTSYGSFFAKTSLIVVGGQTSDQVDDGAGGTTTVTTNHPELYVNQATGAQYPTPNNETSTTKLPAGVFSPTIAIYKDFAFVWGQGDKKDQATAIYAGKLDDTAGLTSVTTTTALPANEPPLSPIACAGEGRLFVAGGTNSAKSYSADINEATGALGTWKNGPDLPGNRSAAGCAVIRGYLYLFGGRIPAITNQILRSKIASDGSMGTWETTAQTLIGNRANVFALTY